MCGIAGIIDFSDHRPDEGLLRRMLGLIRHRGPDAFGIYLDNNAGLASTRLSILDLAGGDQPIHNEDESIWIAYNGEVFNYVELRKILRRGDIHSIRIPIQKYWFTSLKKKARKCCKTSMANLALPYGTDELKQHLLARDRMGIRPLFYKHDGNRLVFASEIKAIFADPTDHEKLSNPIDPVRHFYVLVSR